MILEKKIPLKYLLKQIALDLIFVAFFAAFSHWADEHLVDIVLPSAISAFLGTAISLLLSFKLGQSYDRWWEARKIWGSIVNDSRSLAIQTLHYTDAEKNKETFKAVEKIIHRQIAWCYGLSGSLRKLEIENNIKDFLTEEELQYVMRHENKPLAIVNLNKRAIKQLKEEGKINEFQEVELSRTLMRFIDSMGKSERIKNTVFPKTYRMVLHLSIYIFLGALAASLTDLHSYYEVPVMMIMSLPFFLLEKTALYMQDPFENLPTDISTNAISQTIEMNLRQLLDENDLKKPDVPTKFYVM